ncbi:LPD1 domain-containing protein [Spirosoma jeollabukense]
MQPAPSKPIPKLAPLPIPADVAAKMKATGGNDPAAFAARLNAMPRDQAESVWANTIDYYRGGSNTVQAVGSYHVGKSGYAEQRAKQTGNPNWTAFDDLGANFKNAYVDLAQGVTDVIPSIADFAVSAVSNPSDTSWYRKWDDATDKYFDKAKFYVSPEAQAGIYDEKTGINTRALAASLGTMAGYITSTMIPLVGQVGRAGQAASAGTLAMRMLTDPRLQSAAIGFFEQLPGAKEAALRAGYSRNQAALWTLPFAAAMSALEFKGADALMETLKLAPGEASSIVRQLSKEAAADGFQSLAGKELSEEAFKDVLNVAGKSFFDRLKQPEVRNVILAQIKSGAKSEAFEEGAQSVTESAMQKLFDTYYGNDALGGKGFDPTLQSALIQAATGTAMGGLAGGLMRGFFSGTPTHIGQETIWGKLDTDVRQFQAKHPDVDILGENEGFASPRSRLGTYKIAAQLHADGQLDDRQYGQALSTLDRMVGVSSRLARTNSDASTRFALFNLDNQQQQWEQRLQNEVQAPMQRLTELADERLPGQWVPKDDLSTLDQAEAHDLIHQELPRKAQLAEAINNTIKQSVAGLMNPQTRAQTLKSYKPTLEALADQWDNRNSIEPQQPSGPDQFAEHDVADLSQTMDTPDGRFVLANGPTGRQVLRVETATDGAQTDVTEDTDPTVGRFKGYKLPSKGRPNVSLHPIADQTRHDELLDAFDRNADVAEPYMNWRSRLSENYQDNDLDGLRQAEAVYQKEVNELPSDAPDWQKQDLARKGQWLKAAMASQASNPSEAGYGWADWAESYLGDQMQQAGITRDDLAALPTELQSSVTGALQSGDYGQAQNLIKQSQNGQTSLAFNDSLPTPSEPDTLSARLAAEEERGRLIENATNLAPDLLGGPAILDQIEQIINTGDIPADSEQQLVDLLEQTTRSLDEASAINTALTWAESGQPDGPEAGTSQSETAGDPTTDQSTQSATDGRPTGEPASPAPVGTSPDVVEKTKKRSGNKQPDVIERQPRDLHEAILSYFAKGNRLRRSDLAQYGDPNLMKTAKGGNPYLAYTAGDDKAPSLDLLARSIVEESLGQNMDATDEQAVMQHIIDTVQSFSHNGGPKQQLISYQQEQVQAELGQSDAVVADTTAMTPIQLMEPLMAGMDQAGVPVGIQDQLIDIVAENYVTADGLDWVGVIHLLRANGIFERYQGLRDTLLPLLDDVAQQVPLTNKEYTEWSQLTFAEQESSRMSAEAWEHLGELQALSNEDYNQLTDLFYGIESNAPTTTTARNTTRSTDAAGLESERSQNGSASEDAGLPGQRDDTSGGSGSDTTPDRLEPDRVIELSPEQQDRIKTIHSEYENAIARLTQENDQLTRQADKLRTRTQTEESYTNTDPYVDALTKAQAAAQKAVAVYTNGIFPLPNSSDLLVAKNGQLVDVGYNAGNGFVSAGIPIEQYLSRNPAVAQTYEDLKASAESQLSAITSPDVVDFFAGLRGKTKQEADQLAKTSPLRRLIEPTLATVKRSDTDSPQSISEAADIADAAQQKLSDMEAQLATNQTIIANLQATREQAVELALAAPEQTSLFTSEISSQTIDTENEALAVEELADQQVKAPTETNEELSAEQQAEADETLEKLSDFGQKIGAARKDTAERGYKLGKKEGDKQPGWAKKYKVFAGKDGTFDVAQVNGSFMRTLKRGFKTEQQAYDSIPLVEVASNHRVYQKAEGNYAIYRVYSNGKVWDVQDGFPTREAALQYMAEHATEIIGKKSPVIERPHLDSIQRTGKDYRNGKNATPQLLLDTFGFRGGEFGNWLAADERQEVLNLAYDAFMDLATALDVPPRALSLGGELSIGFGSRGKGLSGAAAHYETSRAVINLTKVKGAGSLAHEWFHGLDNYLAKQDGKASSQRNEQGVFDVPSKDRVYFSHGKSLVRSGVRKELAEAFEAIWKALSTKTVEKAADVSKTQDAVTRTGKTLSKALADLRSTLTRESSYGRKKKPATPEQLDQFDQLASELVAGSIGERAWYAREKSRFNGDYYYATEKALYDVVKEARGSKVGQYDNVSSELVRYQRALTENGRAESGALQTASVKTDFVANAQKLDASRAAPYWSSPHELMARAFEAFVQDKIAQKGQASQYLIHGADNLFYALFGEKPYPEGQERVDITNAFQHLFDTIEAQTDANNVVILTESNPDYHDHLSKSYGSQALFREAKQRLFNGLKNQVLVESVLAADGGTNHHRGLSQLRARIQQRTVIQGYQESGYVNFAGTRVQSHADLVDLFQIHRSPLIEKGHVVLVKNGVIVGNVAITAGLPAATSLGTGSYVQSLIDAYQADGYYLLHNHPSGNHQVSQHDVNTTAKLTEQTSVPMLGSVVIDTDKYSVIDHLGNVAELDYKNPPAQLYNERINISGKNPAANMFLVAKALLKDADYDHVLIGIDSSFGVAGYDVMEDVHDLSGRSQRLGQATGASRFVLLSTASRAQEMPYLPATFMDYIVVDEQSRAAAPGFGNVNYNQAVAYTVTGVSGSAVTRDFTNLDVQEAVPTVSEPIDQLIYGNTPLTSNQPTRPLLNVEAQSLATLSSLYAPKSDARKQLLALPVADIAAILKRQWEPVIRELLALAPESKTVATLQKVRSTGALINAQGELDNQALLALAAELKAGRPKGSEATGRLRDLLWQGGVGGRPDVLTTYTQAIHSSEYLIIDQHGQYQAADLTSEQQDLAQSLQKIDPENVSGPAKYVSKLLTSKFGSNLFLPETVGHILSGNAGSAFRQITKTIRREYVERAAEVTLVRQRQLSDLTKKLAGLSVFDGKASASSVKTLDFEGWIDGKKMTVSLPVAAYLDLYRTIKTQLASAGKSSALAELTPTGSLVRQRVGLDANNQAVTGEYGWVYVDPSEEAAVPKTILISEATFNQLEKRLQTDYGDVLSAVEDFFSYSVAREYLSEINTILTGEPFVLEADYHPTAKYTPAGKRNNVGQGSALLTEARILQTRKTPPLRVVGQDVLARLENYTRQENTFIESAVTIENLRRWRNRHAETLDKTAWTREWVVPYLEALEADLNNPSGSLDKSDSFSEFKIAGVDVGLKAWVRRLTRSNFGGNLTMPIKQLSTYLNLFHAGVIENPFILQAGKELLRLGIDAYRPARQTAGNDLFGNELAEVPYLKEIATNPYAATLLSRILGQNDTYLGAPSVDDFSVNAKDASVQAVRKGIHEVADVALRGMRAADRANLIVTYLSAKYQVQAEIAAGRFGQTIPLDSEKAQRRIADLATEAMYVTNQMSAQSDQTPLARSRSIFSMLVGLYSGQTQRLLNSVLTSAADYIHASDGVDKQKALEQLLWRGGNMIVLNAVLMGVINALWRGLTNALTGEEDEAPVESFAWDVSRNLLTTFPSVPTEALAVLTTRFDSAPWSDEFLSYPAADSFDRLVKGLEAGYNYMGEDDPQKQAKQLNAMSQNIVSSTTRLMGVPSALPKLMLKVAQGKKEPKASESAEFVNMVP